LGHDLSKMSFADKPDIREERVLEFLADGSFLDEKSFDLNHEDIKNRLIDAIQKSRMAKTLLTFAQDSNIDVKITDQVDTVFYDKESQAIFVRDDVDFNDQVLMTIETLRVVWQDLKKARKHPLTFHPDHAVLVSRAQAADLKATLMRCVWELKLAGDDQYWKAIESSTLKDLARTFSREALSDFRNLDNGKAGAAVFESWFLSERSNNQDKILIQTMFTKI